MNQIIELDNRVFEVNVDPDTPGVCRRRLTVELLSGKALTLEESVTVKQILVRAMIDAGARVYRCDAVAEDDEEHQ